MSRRIIPDSIIVFVCFVIVRNLSFNSTFVLFNFLTANGKDFEEGIKDTQTQGRGES